ncbi:MAG TPA: BON domain-containing protein [Dongiaceae bacterium]|nr:BON domain-containing protein [Dongiaceae bacterium]
MSIQTRKFMRAFALTLAVAAASGNTLAADSKMSQDVIDARQETQISTTYALSPHLRAFDLNVSVHNGKAVLTGKADEEVNKELAAQIALGVDGIKEVDNQIVVQADYVPVKKNADRSFGEVIDDASINAEVKSKLLWSKHTDGLTTNVDTKNGKVTLRGTANNSEAKALAGRLAINTEGVRSVDNQLVIKNEKPDIADKTKSTVDSTEQNISDSWITTKVKSSFMYSNNVNGSNIEVTTKNGIVTLSGKVESSTEQALAVEIAENIRGVKSVDAKNMTSGGPQVSMHERE